MIPPHNLYNGYDVRERVATEVLELGQSLFDVVIEAAANARNESNPVDETGARAPFPAEDVRAAADEFFAALRVLLQMEEED